MVLEPEAASLFCRSLDMSNFQRGNECEKLLMPAGTVYMLVDAGGKSHHAARNTFHGVMCHSNGWIARN